MPTTYVGLEISGEGAKTGAAMSAPATPVAPARLHTSSIPELSGNQCSPGAHRELVHVEFAVREVKLPGVLHSFLTVIKGMPAERGVRLNPPEPPLRTGLHTYERLIAQPPGWPIAHVVHCQVYKYKGARRS